jgi:hypothetical protein
MFYLVSAVIVTVVILIMAFAELGATCTWILLGSAPIIALLQAAALGAIVGGLLVLFWKSPTDEDLEG